MYDYTRLVPLHGVMGYQILRQKNINIIFIINVFAHSEIIGMEIQKWLAYITVQIYHMIYNFEY